MRQPREFENILNECLEKLVLKGETVEQCLRSFPEHAAELEPLLQMTLAIKGASDIQPSPEFRDKARYQFYSALQEMERKRNRPVFSWLPRWATVVATIVLVLLLAGGGTAVAASGSLPGEFLYPVKLATEQARLALTPSALGKAELYAKLADERVLEIARMAGKNEPQQIEQTAQRLNVYLTEVADLASVQGGTGGAVMTPAPSAPSEATVFEEVPPVEEAAPSLRSLPSDSQKVQPKVDRRARLKSEMELSAISNAEKLRAMLKTAPESAKPALQQAIDISEAAYEKALRSLD